MSTISAVQDNNFETDVLKSDVPVLVDFWAAWCGPCRSLAPKLEQISASYTGKVKFLKMDVDANQIPMQLGVSGIPTLMIFKGGKLVDQMVGDQPRPRIEEFLNTAL